MRYSAVIFDLDGVICTTDRYHYLAWSRIARELGIPFDEQVNKRLLGVSRMKSFEIILERHPGEMDDVQKTYWTDRKNELYRSMLADMGPQDILPRVIETMGALRDRGVALAVGSSSRNAPFILERLGLDDYFDAVCDGNDITRSKPDPEVFVKAAAKLGKPAGECLVVEDARAGLEAALRGGMDCAAIGRTAVLSGLATWNLRDFSGLLDIVDSPGDDAERDDQG